MRNNFGRCRRRWGTLCLFFFVWSTAKQNTSRAIYNSAKLKHQKHHPKSFYAGFYKKPVGLQLCFK